MAKQSSSSEFVPVNLNKLYGQTSSIPGSSSSFLSSGSNRPRSGGSRNGNMVSLSRPSVRSQTQSSSRASKLAVPRPVNLPSLRKEHAGNDPSVTLTGVSNSSFSGWSKKQSSVANAAVSTADSVKLNSSSETRWNNARLSSPADATTSFEERNSSAEGFNGRKSASKPSSPISEAAIVVRCEDFPTLQATTKPPSAMSREKNKHDVRDHHTSSHAFLLEQYGIEGRIHRLQLQPRQTTREEMRLKHKKSVLDKQNDEIREPSDDLRGIRFPGSSPLIKLNHTSNWTDDERETLDSIRSDNSVGLKNGYNNSDGLPVRNARDSKLLNETERNVAGLGTERAADIGGPGRSTSWNDQSKREWNGNSALIESKMGSLGRSSLNHGKHVSDGGNLNTRDPMQDNVRKYSFNSSGMDDLLGGRMRKNPGSSRNNVSNSSRITHSHSGLSNDLSGLDYGREKRKSVLYTQDKTSSKTSSVLGMESFLAISSSEPKILRKKKEEAQNYHDPVRDLFEAELERVQLLQEQERQRLVLEQERAIELAKKKAEEQERIAREEEMLRLRKEQEAREATARAHKEAEEAARQVDEIRKAKEEDKQRMLQEDERRKEAARKKLIDLEQRIAKREASQHKVSDMDDAVKNKGTILKTGSSEDKDHIHMFSAAEKLNEFVLTDSREEQTVNIVSSSPNRKSLLLLDSDNRKDPSHVQRSKCIVDEENHSTTISSKVHPSDEDALSYKVLPEFNSVRELSQSSTSIQQDGKQPWQRFQDEGFNNGQPDANVSGSRDSVSGLRRYSFNSLSTENDLNGDGSDYPTKGRYRQSLPKQPRVPLPVFGRSTISKQNLHSDVSKDINVMMEKVNKDINIMMEKVNAENAEPHYLESSGPGLSSEVLLISDVNTEISDGTSENDSTGGVECIEGDAVHAVEDLSVSEEAEKRETFEKLEEEHVVEDDEDWLVETECNGECGKDQNISVDGSGYQDWESIKVSYDQDKQHEEDEKGAPVESDLKTPHVEESRKENIDSTELTMGSVNDGLGEMKGEKLLQMNGLDCYSAPNPTIAQQTCSMSTANIPHDFLQLGPPEVLIHNQSFLQQYQQPRPSERLGHSQSFYQQFQQPFSFMAVPLPHSTTVNGVVPNPCLQDISAQQELPYHLQTGILPSAPIVPNAIQIGSIQMPIHLHPQEPQLPHLHQHQSPMFQFGQICHSFPLSQPLQHIQTLSGQMHDRIGQHSHPGYESSIAVSHLHGPLELGEDYCRFINDSVLNKMNADRSSGVDGISIREGNEQPGIETHNDKDNVNQVSKKIPLNGGTPLISPTLSMTYRDQLMGKPSQTMVETNEANQKHNGVPSSGQGHLSPSSQHANNPVACAAVVPTAWSVKPSNEVVSFSRNQLEQGVNSFRFEKLPLKSGPTHENVPATMGATISHGSTLVSQKPATPVSMPGPLSSLLAGEKIQFGAVTSPTVLPSCTRATTPSIVGTIGPPSNASTDCPTNALQLDKSGGPFASNKVCRPGEDEVFKQLADAEAAASAVAVAAISNDEKIGNASNADGSSHNSITHDNFMSFNNSAETKAAVIQGDGMSVALPTDLSVDTPTFNQIPMSNGAGMSGYMLQNMQSITSPFPCLGMGSILGGPPMFGVCPPEATSIVPLEPGVTPIGQWQDRQITSDSFYGAPSTFIGPSALPSIQGHPHMLVYANPYAPVGQFGVNFMGTAYHPSGKQPDWSHTPFTSAIGTLSMNGGDIHAPLLEPKHNGGAPNPVTVVGSSMMPVPTPMNMFDPNMSIPFQAQFLGAPTFWSTNYPSAGSSANFSVQA